MKSCGLFLGLVISLFLFGGYNEAGFNVNLGFNVTIVGPHSQFPRAYRLKRTASGIRRGVSEGVEDGRRPPALQVGHP
jgi:hypothetical protein